MPLRRGSDITVPQSAFAFSLTRFPVAPDSRTPGRDYPEGNTSTWQPQLTAFFRWIRLMNSSFRAHEECHLKGDGASHPIEPRWRLLAALLLLALRSPQRRQPCRPQSSQRLAFFALSRRARAHLEPQRSPCRPQSSQRLAFFALSRRARAHLEPQRSALPAHPSAAHSGASN